MGHKNNHGHDHKEKKIGTFDIIMAFLVFFALWYVAKTISGPEGFSFLKGRLDELQAQEMLISGVLLISLWAILAPLVMTPYLEALYQREAKTSGMVIANTELKKDVEKLELEVLAELRTARLEGIRKRDEKVNAAKKQASEIVDAGKKIADEEWFVFEKEVSNLRSGLLSSVDNEVSSLSSEIIKKILPTEISSKYLH